MIKIKGGVTAATGFSAAALNCGIKRKRKDIALIVSASPAVACGVFTQNRIKAAPILVCKEHLKKTTARAIIVNSGNANTCTGKKGIEDAYAMAEAAARNLGIETEDVLVASTGVIGRQLPLDKINAAVPALAANLSEKNNSDVAEAIMTTDTFPKEMAVKINIKGKEVVIGGVAKGAGMIHPNMATMLCFITTDVYITRRALKAALADAVTRSFNSISVDGDMSTNDTVLVLANGSAENKLLDRKDKDFETFSSALNAVTEHLAKLIVKDGEGATKFVQINIKNARSVSGAKRAARRLATSALFKTALFGEDPNWGRIAAAVGSSGVVFDPDMMDIYMGKTKVVKNGQGVYTDFAALKKLFKKKEIEVTVDFNSGNKDYTMWTCDLSSEYVRVNASYTT